MRRAFVVLVLAASSITCDSKHLTTEQAVTNVPTAIDVPLAPPPPRPEEGPVFEWAGLGPDQLAILERPEWGEVLAGPGVGKGGNRRLPPEGLRGIARLLTAPDAYHGEQESWLPLESTVAMRISDGTRIADFHFDFDYNLLMVTPGDPDATSTLSMSWAVNFTPIRPRLLQILRQAYPDDPQFSQLPAQSDRIRRTLRPDIREVLNSPERLDIFRITSSHSRRRTHQLEIANPWMPAIEWSRPSGSYLYDAAKVASRATAEVRLDAEPRLGNRIILSVSPQPSPAFAAEITEALTNDQTYCVRGQIMCFEPGMAVRYRRSNQSVTFLICLHCLKVLPEYDGFDEPIEGNDFGSLSLIGLERLRNLGHKAFPNDSAFLAGADR